jgi:two-component system, chemotaxis family, chemotaxis protein CheY
MASLDFSLLSFLIVDDQPFSRRIVRSILTGFGSREIYESGNGAEALGVVRITMPSMIITDVVMPAFSGMGFISKVKAPPSPAHGIPIIVLSGYLTKTAAMALRGSGADGLLVKPVSPKALYRHIARIVALNDQAKHPMAFVQDQKKRAEQQRRKVVGLAYL